MEELVNYVSAVCSAKIRAGKRPMKSNSKERIGSIDKQAAHVWSSSSSTFCSQKSQNPKIKRITLEQKLLRKISYFLSENLEVSYLALYKGKNFFPKKCTKTKNF